MTEKVGEGGAVLLEAAWERVFAVSVIWQRLRNCELVIQRKSRDEEEEEESALRCCLK